MNSEGIFRRRRLPHWDVAGHPVFITACLDGSIATAGLSRIENYRKELESRPKPDGIPLQEWEHMKHKLIFGFVDKLLDFESPVRFLEDARQAKIVENAFLHFAGERYTLLAFVVMPSHHHWLFVPNEDWAVIAIQSSDNKQDRSAREIISHSIQSYTGTMCNRVRCETGQYWQHETFDHWVRDESEMFRIIEYIENNPVKAGLVESPSRWQFSSARRRKESNLQQGDAIT